MRLVTTKAASKDSLQSVPFIVQYESRNNQVHFLGAKIGIISESSKFFATLITLSMGDLNSQIRGVFLNSYGPGHTKFTKSLVYSFWVTRCQARCYVTLQPFFSKIHSLLIE